jgi:sec-independent protein translocase protein TatB
MFDIGFGELLLIAVVALVVLGPERLPRAARFTGLWVRRARAQWYSVKAELERELEAEELKRGLQDTQATLRQAQARLHEEMDTAGRQLDEVRRQVEDRPAPTLGTGEPGGAGTVDAAGGNGEPALPAVEGNDEPRRS